MPCKDDHGNNIVKAPPDLNTKKKEHEHEPGHCDKTSTGKGR